VSRRLDCHFARQRSTTLNANRVRLLHRYGALRVIVLDQIHPAADLVSAHQVGVKRLQQVADGVRLLKSGVKPKVVGVIGQDDGHSVVDVGKERIRRLRLVANLVC